MGGPGIWRGPGQLLEGLWDLGFYWVTPLCVYVEECL